MGLMYSLAGRDRFDAVDDLGRGVVLQDVAAHAHIERGVEIVLVLVHRQKDQGGRQAAFADFARDGKPVFDRHREIEYRDGDVTLLQPVEGRPPSEASATTVSPRCPSMNSRNPCRKIG